MKLINYRPLCPYYKGFLKVAQYLSTGIKNAGHRFWPASSAWGEEIFLITSAWRTFLGIKLAHNPEYIFFR